MTIKMQLIYDNIEHPKNDLKSQIKSLQAGTAVQLHMKLQ